MRFVILCTMVVSVLAMPAPPALAQTGATLPAAGTSLGSVTLTKKVLADGQPLAPGTYQVRLSGDDVKPAAGQTPDAERYVEFLKGGKVVGREMATIVTSADIAEVGKGLKPVTGGARVELLKGNDYLRVWINRSGLNYIIHLPVGA